MRCGIAVCAAAAAGWAGPAWAGTWQGPEPFAQPVLEVNLVSVGGVASAQASAGLLGGLRLRYSENPHWLSTTRGALVGTYGLNTGSLGGDVRIGSFIGPDGKYVTFQLGPDFWFNGYGNDQSVDYFEPWSPGVDLRTVLTIEPVEELGFVVEATPGWAFLPTRQGGDLGPVHELTLTGLVVLRTPVIAFTIGYSRHWGVFGARDAIVLSGGF